MQNRSRTKRWAFKTEIVIASVIVTLVLMRITAPYIGKYYINSILKNKLESYQGSIEDLSLRVTTGSYFIEKLVIVKKENLDSPFIYLDNLNVHLDWWMLMRGKAVLKIEIFDGQLNFVDSKKPEKKQLEITQEQQEHWSEALDAIIPLSIRGALIENLSLNFKNRDLKDANLNKVLIKSAYVRHLVDPEYEKNNLSSFQAEGLVNDHASLKIYGGVNIKKDPLLFDVKYKLKDFKLVSTNKLLKHYVPIDLTSGLLSVLGESNGDSKNMDGYARVYIDDLDILKIDQSYKSAPHFIIEWAGGFTNWIMSVLGDGKITTEVPFKIENGDFKLDSSKTFWNTLENLGDSLPYEFKEGEGK